jgi:hypothetical protein
VGVGERGKREGGMKEEMEMKKGREEFRVEKRGKGMMEGDHVEEKRTNVWREKERNYFIIFASSYLLLPEVEEEEEEKLKQKEKEKEIEMEKEKEENQVKDSKQDVEIEKETTLENEIETELVEEKKSERGGYRE